MSYAVSTPVSAAAPLPQASRRQLLAVAAGNTIEVYDFLIYSYFAIYIGQAFFPSENPATSLLASLATFGAGFVTRPIGAIVLGRVADRIGRKPAMLISFGIMGLTVLGLALTPTYASIGIAAPIIVILLRLLQGFALGGEIGASTSYLFEIAPPNRRGLYVALQFVGNGCAGLGAGAVGYVLARTLSDEALATYGWRIAMLLGVAIIPLGLMLRRNLIETLDRPDAPAAVGSDTPARSYVVVGILGFVMLAAAITVNFVLKYMTTYAIADLNMAPELAYGSTAVGGFVAIIASFVGGWLSDRFGRRPLMIVPWTLLLVCTMPAFQLLSQHPTALVLFGTTCFLAAVGSIAATTVLLSVTESLPKSVRSGTLALVYAMAAAIFGGSAQFNVAWLITVTGSPLAPGWYMATGVLLGLVAMWNMRETAPVKQRPVLALASA